jgi:hypothetical protein
VDLALVGPNVVESESAVGGVVELAGGLMIDIRQLSIGGQLAVSKAWHSGRSDLDLPVLDLDHNSIEVDISFVAAFSF